jgi:hypothetical protein
MTSELFEGDFTDMWVYKSKLALMGAQAECQGCKETGARTPIVVSRNWSEWSACARATKWPVY